MYPGVVGAAHLCAFPTQRRLLAVVAVVAGVEATPDKRSSV
jgi:hypothetical protein